jgi:hypothetical protein
VRNGALPRRHGAFALACLVATAGLTLTQVGPGAGAPATASAAVSGPGPNPQFRCAFDVNTDAFTGAHASASAIGWLGDHNSVITCLGGTFVVQDGPAGYFVNYGFGVYDGSSKTTWADAGGWLPEQVTTFTRDGAQVSITEFADRVVVGGHPYVAVYSRVRVANPTGHSLTIDAAASTGLTPLSHPSDTVPAHAAVNHDYVVASDRFGGTYAWPSTNALAAAGGFARHEAHMRAFWRAQVAAIAQLQLPDRQLVDAYDSGFVTTQITRMGNALDTGVNGYQMEFSHDVIGILTNLFTQGYFADAHALLTEARNAVGSQAMYVDGLWTYPLPWAVYLMKTGDAAFVRANFDTPGPLGSAAQPSIEDAARAIANDRTGPGGTMEPTHDIDTTGSWTVDDYEALLGLAAYEYIAHGIGNTSEATWASGQYTQLLDATDAALSDNISANHLDYLPCALSQPNTANRCANPEDANWTSPFGFGSWAWEAGLLGAPVSGPGLTMIDATYDYGFGRLKGLLPPNTTGGFPVDWYSSAYNAVDGMSGLASARHRDQGILDYQFMLTRTQSGPLSWWESVGPPAASPWVGSHPAAGQGSAPHAWGMAGANKVLLDSLVALRADGALVVGRGVPAEWLGRSAIAVSNFPSGGERRLGVTISSASSGRSVTLSMRGAMPAGPILFELPSFVDNVASTSAGTLATVDQSAGTVRVPARVRQVTVTLRHAP